MATQANPCLTPIPPAPSSETDCLPQISPRDLCTCRLTPVHSTDIDPPEMIVDRRCPVHGDGGPDPDEAYERMRDEAWEVGPC